jgi:Spy/CpxP family protein refolding chaperone
MKLVNAVLACALALGMTTAMAQQPQKAPAADKPADNMQILRDKIKADKKLLVASNMELTESEAKGFWPIYDTYQKELEAINQRTGKLIESYAADQRAGTFTDDKAKKAINEMIAVNEAEAKLMKSYAPKLNKVLPAKKTARYLQIENKIRAAIKYELATNVPLAY